MKRQPETNNNQPLTNNHKPTTSNMKISCMPPPIGITTLLLCFFVNAALGQSGQKYATGANNLSATDKLGSKNYAPVRIVTDNIERARFTGDGLFGLGTATPTATFDLSGSFRYRNGSQQPGFFLATDANGNASWQQVPFSSHWTLNGNDLSYSLGSVSVGTDIPLGAFTVTGASFFNGDVAVNGVLSVIKLVNADTIAVGPGTPSTTFEVFGDGKISGNLEAGNFSTQKITTLRITSPDSVLRIGENSIEFDLNFNRIRGSVVTNQVNKGLGLGQVTNAKGVGSTAMGRFVETAPNATEAVVIGSGILNAGTFMINDKPQTLMLGFNSDIPTFFVGSSNGAGTTGNVGIGVSTNLQNKLEVAGGVVIGSAFAGQGNTLVPNGMRVEGLTAIGIPGQDNLNVRLVLEGQLKLNADRTIINGFNGGDNHWLRTSLISDDGLFMSFNGTPNGAANSVNISPRGGTGLTVVHDANSGRKRVGIGTAFPAFELDVCGTIRSEEWIVETLGCDFVFDRNYSLLTLKERKKIVLQNKHLLYIQPASEMQEQGAQMSKTVMGLLQNGEEHELYLYQLDERDDKLEKRIEQLEKRDNDKEKRIKDLEKSNDRKEREIKRLKNRLAEKKQ